MKKTIGNSLILFGIADAVYLYGAGLTAKIVIFSVPFLELVAAFVVANFLAVILLSDHANETRPRRVILGTLHDRVKFIR